MTLPVDMSTTNRPPCCPCCGHAFGSKGVQQVIQWEKGLSSIMTDFAPEYVRDNTIDTGPHGGRLPLLLQCGHSMCEGCLTKLMNKPSSLVTCSVCQTPMSLKDDNVKGLPVDTYLVGLVTQCKKSTVDRIKTSTIQFQLDGTNSGSARKKEKAPKREMCVECGTRAATCTCHKCESIMCGTCFDKVHKASKSLRKHQASPLDECDLATTFPSTCSQHDNRPIEYFCEDDQTPICSHCVIIGPHKKHAISSMEDKNKKALIELEPALQVCTSVLKRMKKSEKLLSATAPSSPGLFKILDDISLHFRQAHGLLQAREAQLIEEFHRKYEVSGSLEEMRSKLQSDMWGLDQAIKEANRVLQAGSLTVINGQALLAKLKQSTSLPCIALKIGTDNLPDEQITCNFQDDLFDKINSYGNLSGHTHIGLSLKSLDEVPSDIAGDDEPSIFDGPIGSAMSDSVSITTESATLDTDNEDSLSQTSEATSQSSKTSKTSNKGKLPHPSRVRIRPLKTELVYVTHIKNPCCFMVQRMDDFERLKMLQRKITKYCSSAESKQEIPEEVDVGDFVLSTFKNTWYRARVTKVMEEEAVVEVLYIDYGNSDVVLIENLRNIKPMFMKVPQLSKKCSLQSIVPANPSGEWSDALCSFARINEDKPMQLKVLSEDDDVMYVDLSKPGLAAIDDDPSVSVRDMLVFMELAAFTSPLTVPMSPGGLGLKQNKKFFHPNIPNKGAITTALISFVESPDKIYIQLVGNEARYLHQVMTEIQTTYTEDTGDLYTIFSPKKDMVCVCQFTDDNAWYRAKVLDLPGRQNVWVKYVDYGNEEIVSHWKLKKIHDRFLRLPMQAIHCRLVDVEPTDKKAGWSSEVKQELSMKACFQKVTLEVKDVTSSGAIDVVMTEILDESGKRKPICFNEWLVDSGAAKSTGPGSHPRPTTPEDLEVPNPIVLADSMPRSVTPPNMVAAPECRSAFMTPVQTPPAPEPVEPAPTPEVTNEKPPYQEVKVSHIVNPGEMYMHLADTEDQRERMMRELTDLLEKSKDFPDPGVWKPEDNCAIKYTKDSLWYRGKIVTLSDDNKIKVELVDFGFHDTVAPSELRYLPDQFKVLPQFVFRCHIDDIQPAGDITRWSRTSTEYLLDTLRDQICYIVTKGTFEEGSVAVDLLKEEIIQGDALTGNQVNYISVGKLILEKGLALPKRLKKGNSQFSGRVVLSALNGTPTSTNLTTPPLSQITAPRIELATLPPAKPKESPVPENLRAPPIPDKFSTDPQIKLSPQDSPQASETSESGESPKEFDKSDDGGIVSECKDPTNEDAPADVTLVAEEDEVEEEEEKEEEEESQVDESQDAAAKSGSATPPPLVRPSESPAPVPPCELLDNQPAESPPSPPLVRPSESPAPVPPCELLDNQPAESPPSPPLVRPSESPAPAPPCELLDYQPAEMPSSGVITVVPTYVDFDCHVFVQEVKPDDDPEGRLGHFLKESTIEVKIQNAYFQKMHMFRAKIIRDGNCLFRACAQAIFTNQDDHRRVREGVVDTFLHHWYLFDSVAIDSTKDEYIFRMTCDGTYGGELEIQAICFTFQVQIDLYMGGLMSPITRRIYGNSSHPIFVLSYVSDGLYDSGHYDLIVRSQNEYDIVEMIYERWRKEKVVEFQMSDRFFDNNKYEQSLLDQLMAYLQIKYQKSAPNPHAVYRVGQAVVAQYTDDNNFYRAKILDVTDKGYKVLYVDFGNFQIMPPTLLRDAVELPDIPRQCYECVLDGVIPISEDGITMRWPVPALNKIHELVVGKTLSLYIKDVLDGPTLIVDLRQPDGRTIAEVMLSKGLGHLSTHDFEEVPEQEGDQEAVLATTAGSMATANVSRMDYIQLYGIPQRLVLSPYPQPKTPIEADVLIVMVTQVDYPNCVYLQHQKQEEADEAGLVAINNQLDHLLEVAGILNMKADSLPALTDVKPGMACVAQYTLDECWYRAEVLSTGHDPENYCGVLFIDYGSSEYLPTSSLRQIPEELMNLPTQAFKCLLSGIEPPIAGDPGSWDPNVTLKMTELLAPQTLTAIVKSTQLELELDLYPQDQFHALGLDAPLAYQPLIDQDLVSYNRLDPENSTIIEETYVVEEEGDEPQTRERLSWAERTDMGLPEE